MTTIRFNSETLLEGNTSVAVDVFHGKPGGPGIPISHGSSHDLGTEVLLQLTKKQVYELGGFNVGQLATWCQAFTGQGGQLELVAGANPDGPAGSQAPEEAAQRLHLTKWFYMMTSTTFSLEETIVPFTEFDRGNFGQSQQTTSTDVSSAYRLKLYDPSDAPSYLITTFPDGTQPNWRFARKGHREDLRALVERRDGGACVFTGYTFWDVAHLVRAINDPWALVHITCTRAPLSKRSCQELGQVEGMFDARVAIAMQAGLHLSYDRPFSIAPSVHENGQDAIALVLVPLGTQGSVEVKGARIAGVDNGIRDPQETRCLTRPIRDAIESRPEPPDQSARQTTQTNCPAKVIKAGRPFDIYVEFGLGARVLGSYGTPFAYDIAKASPLCQAYLDRDEIARSRAAFARDA